jgi:hypothetical protein
MSYSPPEFQAGQPPIVGPLRLLIQFLAPTLHMWRTTPPSTTRECPIPWFLIPHVNWWDDDSNFAPSACRFIASDGILGASEDKRSKRSGVSKYSTSASFPADCNNICSGITAEKPVCIEDCYYHCIQWKPVVLYGCDTWSLNLREEHRLKDFENRILRKIFGPKREEDGSWRKLHNDELRSLVLH